jgi:hypothetical protein
MLAGENYDDNSQMRWNVAGDKMANDDEENFLDNDETEGVSSSVHDWTFDQIMVMGLPAIPTEERKLINWSCPDPMFTTKALRYIGKQYDVSFSIIVQNALVHGFSIFQHEHATIISLMGNLDDAAIINESDTYVNHLTYKPIVARDVQRMVTTTDVATAELMGNIAAIVGTSRTHLAATCILMSLRTGDVVPNQVKDRFQKHINSFETGLKMYQIMGTNLI